MVPWGYSYMAHIGVKVIVFLLAPASIGSLTRHPPLMKLNLLKEFTMNQVVHLVLGEHYKLRLTALGVLEITDLS